MAQAPTSNGTTWSVSYDVKVTNSGPVATTYNLSDTPTFGPNVTVTKSSSGAIVSTTAPFTLQLATNKSINPGITDAYTVTVEFTVGASASSGDLDCSPTDGSQATGTLNTATVTFNGSTIKDDACAPVPKLEYDEDRRVYRD